MSNGEKKSIFGHGPEVVRGLGKLHLFAGGVILAASVLFLPAAAAGVATTLGAYEVVNGAAHFPVADALEPKKSEAKPKH